MVPNGVEVAYKNVSCTENREVRVVASYLDGLLRRGRAVPLLDYWKDQ